MIRVLCMAVGCVFALAGCFDIEQRIELNEDMSGTATITMAIDMEPMAYVGAMMERAMSGQEGEPTEAEIAAARQEMIEQQTDDEMPDAAAVKAAAKESLPDGIRLVSADFTQEELKVRYVMTLAFDNVSDLGDLELANPQGVEDDGSNPMDKPFEGLKIVDEGDTLLITSEPLNPAKDQMESGQIPPEGEEIFRRVMGGLRVAFILKTPFEAIEHNATRVDGDTLYWEYDAQALMGQAGTAEPSRARFRK